jgi:hypothetical protein
MMFTYWTGQAEEPESFDVWRDKYPKFSVFGDEDVLPLLKSDDFRDIYHQIGIPACKSDIARLVLLREYGGLYIDSHMGPSSGSRLAETLEGLARFELILFSKKWEQGFNFMNGVLAARRQAPVLDLLIDKAFSNLICHKHMEDETSDYVPYNIFSLTGTAVMLEIIFDATAWGVMKREFKERVDFHVMETGDSPGFHIYQFYGYRKPGEHWSERQQRERLFRKELDLAFVT